MFELVGLQYHLYEENTERVLAKFTKFSDVKDYVRASKLKSYKEDFYADPYKQFRVQSLLRGYTGYRIQGEEEPPLNPRYGE